MKTICIAGKNNIACDICAEVCRMFKDRTDIKLVASLTKGDAGINGWQRSYKAFCEGEGIEILSLEELYEIDDLYFFSTEYDRIVRPEKFRQAKLFNIHFSLLPAYKGILPSVLPILNGEKMTGVTLHLIRSGIDTGEVIAREEYVINDDDFSIDIYEKLCELGTATVVGWIPRILNNDYEAAPQSEKGSSYFGRGVVDYSTLALNVNATAFQIRNQVRAFSFRPYQMLSWNGNRIMDCTITSEASCKKPGTILSEDDTTITISTIDYDAVLYKDILEELLLAIAAGDNSKAKSLCVSGRVINDRECKHGWTPLIVAAYNNNIEMAEYLIERGADLNAKNYSGTNLLMYAKDCFFNHKDATIFRLLLEKGLSVEEEDYSGRNLFDYLNNEQLEEIKKLL